MATTEPLLGNDDKEKVNPTSPTAGKARLTEMEVELKMWDKYEGEDFPDVFGFLELAKDGGFSEVKDLYAHTRWASAAILIIFVIYNLEALTVLDIQLMFDVNATITGLGGDPDSVMHSFYFSEGIVKWVASKIAGHDVNVSPVGVLGALELIGLLGFLGKVIYCCVYIKIDDGFRRWSACQDVFWNILPAMSCYSAMKLLNNIVPAVASARFLELLASFNERRAEKKSLAPVLGEFGVFVFMLIFGFIAGFDTFLMKLRIVAARADTFSGMLPCLQFLVQLLGVVQLGPFVRKRLFVFIFGGEDGVMQDEETELMETWNALLARRMWRDLPRAHFFAVMLSFSDEDFQSLVLNEDEDAKAEMQAMTVQQTPR